MAKVNNREELLNRGAVRLLEIRQVSKIDL